MANEESDRHDPCAVWKPSPSRDENSSDPALYLQAAFGRKEDGLGFWGYCPQAEIFWSKDAIAHIEREWGYVRECIDVCEILHIDK